MKGLCPTYHANAAAGGAVPRCGGETRLEAGDYVKRGGARAFGGKATAFGVNHGLRAPTDRPRAQKKKIPGTQGTRLRGGDLAILPLHWYFAAIREKIAPLEKYSVSLA